MSNFSSYSLSNHQRQSLSSAAPSTGHLSGDAARAALLEFGFPVDRLVKQLFHSSEPFVVIDNLPVDQVGSEEVVGPTPVTSFVLRMLMDALNLTIFAYPQEKEGALYHDLHPITGAELTYSNAGRVPFALHIENPYLPRAARPTVLAIAGINNESNTETMVLPVSRITAGMPLHIREALESPTFTFRQSDSFQLNGYAVYRRNTAILRSHEGHDEFRWAITNQASSTEGEQAIDWVKNIYEDLCERIIVKPGQVLIFNNHRCLHGRGAVTGRRWMKRVYGIADTSLLDQQQLIDVWDILADSRIDHSF